MTKLTLFLTLISLCLTDKNMVFAKGDREPVRIAIVSDAHVQDTSRLRSMDDQLHSTRLFNENYFAFLAALDDIVRRGIHYVVLPGDLTDDGQPVNVRLIRRLLQQYTEKHAITFFVMTGNHDPSRPFTTEEEKGDLKKWGYQEIHEAWVDFGFYPQKKYRYWATPFSNYVYANYNYNIALREAEWKRRVYKCYTADGKTLFPAVPDGSYVVEPIDGLWLLMIDAAVYDPAEVTNDTIRSFNGAGTGYKDVLSIKPYLLPWIRRVVQEARMNEKTLIAFSHYPMMDYNSGGTKFLVEIARPGRFDIARFPDPAVTELLTDAGLTLHFGGHIHLNDDALFITAKGKELRNIQVPSTCGYVPAYKILAIDSDGQFDVETVSLKEVSGFDAFFSRYCAEWDSLCQSRAEPLWSRSILSTTNYREFCELHLRELVRLRYLKNDWLPIAEKQFSPMRAVELFTYVGLSSATSMDWTGFDMIVDFYKLRMGGELALSDIPVGQIMQYNQLIEAVIQRSYQTEFDYFLFNFCQLFKSRLLAVSSRQ